MILEDMACCCSCVAARRIYRVFSGAYLWLRAFKGTSPRLARSFVRKLVMLIWSFFGDILIAVIDDAADTRQMACAATD
jgi:hypothetical protein